MKMSSAKESVRLFGFTEMNNGFFVKDIPIDEFHFFRMHFYEYEAFNCIDVCLGDSLTNGRMTLIMKNIEKDADVVEKFDEAYIGSMEVLKQMMLRLAELSITKM